MGPFGQSKYKQSRDIRIYRSLFRLMCENERNMQHKIVGYLTILLSVVVLCSALGYVEYSYREQPIVSTSSGHVVGKCLNFENGNIATYLGIPYAEPPIGKNRFRKPKPIRRWDGLLIATNTPQACVQGSQGNLPWVTKTKSSEDCLYLSIWTPCGCNDFVHGPVEKLPVMVWIHGGGFYSGWSGEDFYDGSTLASVGNVVVVTMNYRVGSFGFLHAGTEDAPGNMGMLDQATAMRWVKYNIDQFGGDPDSITLFGESAGAISVGIHIVSPQTNFLFNKAIMQSTSPYHPVLASRANVGKFKSNVFASAAGCADDKDNVFTNPQKVVNCLKALDSETLAKVEGTILETLPFFFLPTFGDEFLPQSPIEAIDSGNYRKIPLLIGANKDEGALFINQLVPDLFGQKSAADLNVGQAKSVITGLFQNNTKPTPDVTAEFYLRNVSENDYETIRKRIHHSFGDYVFVCPSVFFAEKVGDAYFYFFTHRPSNTQWGEWVGTTHFDDVPFVFGMPIKNPQSYTSDEVKLSCEMIQRWTMFARNGTPEIGGDLEKWPRYSNGQYREINTDATATFGDGPHKEQCNFWREYFSSGR